ncbi:alpha/beta hydrolase [Sphingosinicella terrae]|uniref:alpha/beta hydrolase n=1 Tax=Sphingosinicella terrae TaxID=2172047 RepID=UPI0013B411C6|nr:alpha/beta hydrolase-fold protein [Sphingosinicella terrae]
MERSVRAKRRNGLLALFCILTAIAVPVPAQNPPAAVAEAPIVIGTSHRLDSAILGDTREINVWLPPEHGEGDARFPVLYLLDGALDQDFQHMAGLAQLGSLSWTFGPVIVVGVQTRQRRAELTPPPADPRYRAAFPEAGGAERFRRFIAEEVIPFVEARYRAGPRRGLIGESLAGLFVVDTFLERPDLFHDYVAVSPSLWWDDRADMRRAAERLARRSYGGRRLYLAVANEGGTMQDGVDRLRAALAERPPEGLEFRYADRSASETHATIYHGAALDALRWLYARPPLDYGPTPWFMIEGASPPAETP